jgi:hypothetical protein
MIMMQQFVTFLAVLAIFAAVPTRAAIIAQYTLNGATNSVDTELNSVAGGINANGVPLTFTTVGGQQGLDANANDVGAGDFYAFTVTASSGFFLNLNGGTFLIKDRTDNAGTFSYTVSSSVLGQGVALGTYSLGTANTWTSETINLSGAGYNNLSSITFYINLNDNSSASSRHLYFDDILLNGSVTPVPEPTTWAAGLFGGIFALGVLGQSVRKHLKK